MADDHDRVVNASERVERRLRAVVMARARIVEGEIGRQRIVTALSQRLGKRLPARAVVPVAVDEQEGRHSAEPTPGLDPGPPSLRVNTGDESRRSHPILNQPNVHSPGAIFSVADRGEPWGLLARATQRAPI